MTEARICAVGDVFLGGLLSEKIEEYGDKFIAEAIREIFKGADICFCNFESPLCKMDDPPEPNKTLLFAKEQAVDLIKRAGFNVVSLANNHTMDFGWRSLQKTIKLLKRNKIKHFGAGKNIREARRPLVLNVRGLRIAFLAYSWALPVVKEGAIAATGNSPGVSPYNLKFIKEDIKKVRSGVDYVFLSIHWQDEFSHYPPPQIISEAHQIIDAGANVILAHHPHVLQGFEKYKNGLIFYSLSNFMFSPWFATNNGRLINYENTGRFRNWYKESREGLILKFSLQKNRPLAYEMIPTMQGRKPVVSMQLGKYADKTLDKIKKWSLEYQAVDYERNYEKFLRQERKFRFLKAVRNEIDTYGLANTALKAWRKLLTK